MREKYVITFILLLITLLLVPMWSSAEVTLTVEKGSAPPGANNVSVEVSLENQSDFVKGGTFYICDVDNYLSCTGIETTDRTNKCSFYNVSEQADGCCKVLFAYGGTTNIGLGQGAIFLINYSVSADAPEGVCRELTIDLKVGGISNENIMPLKVILEPGEFCFPPCTVDADCNDGLFCNGDETCDVGSGTCQPGSNPCTRDQTCDEVHDECDDAVISTTTTIYVPPPSPKTTTTIGGTSSSTSSITTTTVKPTTTTTIPIPLPTTSVVSTSTTTTAMSICPIVQIYGEDSFEVQVLRVVRDEVLSKTSEGREIIELYYQWSPEIIKAVEENEGLKRELKSVINEILLLL